MLRSSIPTISRFPIGHYNWHDLSLHSYGQMKRPWPDDLDRYDKTSTPLHRRLIGNTICNPNNLTRSLLVIRNQMLLTILYTFMCKTTLIWVVVTLRSGHYMHFILTYRRHFHAPCPWLLSGRKCLQTKLSCDLSSRQTRCEIRTLM